MASSLLHPFDTILGTRSGVRLARVLARDREPMTVREASRRSGEHLRAAQTAVARLMESGVVVQVGTGKYRLVAWNPEHPLAAPLEALFAEEQTRRARILDRLASLVSDHAADAECVWVSEREGTSLPILDLGLVAGSAVLDAIVDSLRASVVPLMKAEKIGIEVRGWTQPDLELLDASPFESRADSTLISGTLVQKSESRATARRSGRRSHSEVDAVSRERAEQLALMLRARPELIRQAKQEIVQRLASSRPRESRTLREWEQILDGMPTAYLLEWIVSDEERATRLRQSLPLTFLRALEEMDLSRSGGTR